MTILILYQDIQSGAKIATESIVKAYRAEYSDDHVITYKQQAHPYTGRFAFVRNMVWSMWDFGRVLRREQDVDVIVSTQYTFALPWRVVRPNTPTIFHFHGDQRFPRIIHRQIALSLWYHRFVSLVVMTLQFHALRVATRVAFVSEQARTKFLRATSLRKLRSRSVILPNGVDPAIYKPAGAAQKAHFRKRNGRPHGIHLGYIGRIDAKKGIHLIIAALSSIRTPTTLWIAHPSPTDHFSESYLQRLVALAASVEPRHSVRFIENPKPITDIYGMIDYLILPSEQEMFPLVILEALSSGVLPIVTGVGGAREAVLPVSSSLIMPSASEVAVSRAIRRVMSLPPSQRRRLRIRGIQVAKKHSWRNSAAVLRRVALAIQRQ